MVWVTQGAKEFQGHPESLPPASQSSSTPRLPQVTATTRAPPLTFTVEVLKKGGELSVPQRVGLGHPTATLPRRSHGASMEAAGSEGRRHKASAARWWRRGGRKGAGKAPPRG